MVKFGFNFDIAFVHVPRYNISIEYRILFTLYEILYLFHLIKVLSNVHVNTHIRCNR